MIFVIFILLFFASKLKLVVFAQQKKVSNTTTLTHATWTWTTFLRVFPPLRMCVFVRKLFSDFPCDCMSVFPSLNTAHTTLKIFCCCWYCLQQFLSFFLFVNKMLLFHLEPQHTTAEKLLYFSRLQSAFHVQQSFLDGDVNLARTINVFSWKTCQNTFFHEQ